MLNLRHWTQLFLSTAICASLLTVPGSALGQDDAARRIRLSDGRQYDGIVLQSTPEGMLLQVPQGRTLVPYGSLAEISTISMQDFLGQAPLRIGLSPITAGNAELEALARHLDDWTLTAARALPSTEVVAPPAWQAKLVGIELSVCRGDASCLRGLAEDLQLDYLLVPTLTGKLDAQLKLGLTGFVTKSGATVAADTISFSILDEERDPRGTGSKLLEGVFTALGFQPTTGLGDVARDAFATRAMLPAPPPTPETEPAPVAEAEAAPEPVPETEGVAATVEAPSRRPRTGLSRGQTIALGFLPVPGLSSALHGDKVGFVVSLTGTIAASFATIYLIGATARTEAAFWTPTVLAPYAINVAFNQVSLLVRSRKVKARAPKKPVTGVQVAPTASPILSLDERGRTVGGGGAIWLRGRF